MINVYHLQRNKPNIKNIHLDYTVEIFSGEKIINTKFFSHRG
jgi:hypothetical protein